MKRFIVAIAVTIGLILFFSSPVFGQTAVDTVWVTVEGRLTESIITQIDTTLAPGDTIEFVAIGLDQDGDEVSIVNTWASSDSTVVRIDQVTGIAVGLRKGRVAISVLSEQVSALHLAWFRDGELNFTDPAVTYLQVLVDSPGDSAWVDLPDHTEGGGWAMDKTWVANPDPTTQYCAYLVGPTQKLVAQAPGPPTCLIAFAPPRFPPRSVFAVVPRVRPNLVEWGSSDMQ